MNKLLTALLFVAVTGLYLTPTGSLSFLVCALDLVIAAVWLMGRDIEDLANKHFLNI